jgi:hypothetical protein
VVQVRLFGRARKRRIQGGLLVRQSRIFLQGRKPVKQDAQSGAKTV